MARARGAKPEAKTVRLFADALAGFPDEVIAQACDEFEAETIGEYTPRWPALEPLKAACRRIQTGLNPRQKFYCAECVNECGMLYFDKPKGGRRLRGVEIVTASKRYCQPCPCGGTDYDWEAMARDKAAHPGKYKAAPEAVIALDRKAQAAGR